MKVKKNSIILSMLICVCMLGNIPITAQAAIADKLSSSTIEVTDMGDISLYDAGVYHFTQQETDGTLYATVTLGEIETITPNSKSKLQSVASTIYTRETTYDYEYVDISGTTVFTTSLVARFYWDGTYVWCSEGNFYYDLLSSSASIKINDNTYSSAHVTGPTKYVVNSVITKNSTKYTVKQYISCTNSGVTKTSTTTTK